MAQKASDLKIGQRLGTDRSGEAVTIKRLHELCSQNMTPHVHVVTSVDIRCLSFNSRV